MSSSNANVVSKPLATAGFAAGSGRRLRYYLLRGDLKLIVTLRNMNI